MSLNLAVASKNPVKINAAKEAFESFFLKDKFITQGYSCPSEVSSQPMGERETLNGAKNRLQSLKAQVDDADFYCSIEGGIEKIDSQLFVFAWIILESKDIYQENKTATFRLPESLASLVNEGKELGDADDIVFKRENSKQQDGTVGALTNNLITRTDYYRHAIILGLISFGEL